MTRLLPACRGEIEACFRRLPSDSLFSSKLSFSPESGVIPVGGSQVISVQLLSDLLGAFDETFEWELNGTSQLVKLQFKGRVGGPIYKVGTLRQPARGRAASCSAVRCPTSGAASQARLSTQLSTVLHF